MPHDVPFLERPEPHEGGDPIHLTALALAEELRRRRHGPAEGSRKIAGESFREGVLTHVEVEAAVDLLHAGHERLPILGPIHAGGDERADRTDLARREIAILSADLEDSLEVAPALLLARIAQGGLNPDTQVEVLDGREVLEPADRLHSHGEVVRILLPCDLRESDPLVWSQRRHRLAEELREREVTVDLGPAGPQEE